MRKLIERLERIVEELDPNASRQVRRSVATILGASKKRRCPRTWINGSRTR